MPVQYGDEVQYFYRDTISIAEDQFICSWVGDYTPPDIKLVFQEVSGATILQ